MNWTTRRRLVFSPPLLVPSFNKIFSDEVSGFNFTDSTRTIYMPTSKAKRLLQYTKLEQTGDEWRKWGYGGIYTDRLMDGEATYRWLWDAPDRRNGKSGLHDSRKACFLPQQAHCKPSCCRDLRGYRASQHTSTSPRPANRRMPLPSFSRSPRFLRRCHGWLPAQHVFITPLNRSS